MNWRGLAALHFTALWHLIVGKTVGKDAKAQLHEVDGLAKECNLPLVGVEPSHEKLVNYASGFAGPRRELILSDRHFWSLTDNLEVVKVHVRIETANECEEAVREWTVLNVSSTHRFSNHVLTADGRVSTILCN